jgi:K+-transporting ATPase c subunit
MLPTDRDASGSNAGPAVQSDRQRKKKDRTVLRSSSMVLGRENIAGRPSDLSTQSGEGLDKDSGLDRPKKRKLFRRK